MIKLQTVLSLLCFSQANGIQEAGLKVAALERAESWSSRMT